MGSGILQLHIITCYSQYLAMFVVIDMVHYHSLTMEALSMVKHHPKFLHISTTLCAPNYINSNSNKIHKHLEHKKTFTLDYLRNLWSCIRGRLCNLWCYSRSIMQVGSIHTPLLMTMHQFGRWLSNLVSVSKVVIWSKAFQ